MSSKHKHLDTESTDSGNTIDHSRSSESCDQHDLGPYYPSPNYPQSPHSDSISGLDSGEGIDSFSDESHPEYVAQNQLEALDDEAQRQWIHLTICNCQPHCATATVVRFLK